MAEIAERTAYYFNRELPRLALIARGLRLPPGRWIGEAASRTTRCFAVVYDDRATMTFEELFAKWSGSGAAERANKDAFLLDLCEALGVEKPAPYNKVPGNPYVFEREVILLREGHS